MAYEYWQEELKLLAPATKQGYVHYFNAFIKWLKVSPEELYLWQLRLNQDKDQRNNRELIHKFVEYYRFRMSEDGLKGSTVHRMSHSIQSFFPRARIYQMYNRTFKNVFYKLHRIITRR